MLVSVKFQLLVVGLFVAIIVQFVGDRFGLDWSVTRKYGEVLRTTVALVRVLEMDVNAGAAGAGRVPPLPMYVTAPYCAKALPSMLELEFIVMEA